MPPLTWFRAFEAAARNLSFTGAAEELGLTQSAISQHVRSLELRFGVPLFERKPRGLALTDDGRRLLPDVGRAIETLADISRAYDKRPAGRSLTVATSVSFAQWYLAPGIGAFRAANPDINVRIINTTWPDEYHRPIADVEIRFGSKSLVGKGAKRLEPDALVAVGAPGLGVDRRTLKDHPLIEAVGTSDDWKRWSEAVGDGEERRPSLLVDSHGLAVDLARQGAGVALTSSLIACPSLADGSLIRLDLPSAPAIDGFYLAVNDGAKGDAAAFSSWLEARVRGIVQSVACIL